MKFIKLEILNLASLDRQGGEVINFEEGALGDSTIFSIVGPTGSGKSTILDAICLALYDRAPRYPWKKNSKKDKIRVFGDADADEDNRPAPTDRRNILTRGKKEGYSKLTFLANNENVYRAEWHVRFKTKRFDEPTKLLYQLTQEDGQLKEIPAEWDALSTIIGLDYEQFLRTVLIAQGSFANFLTAREEERFVLLEKLIGCETLYTDIANKIRDENDKAVSQYNEVAANFAAYEKDLIPDEELETLGKRIAELKDADKRVKEELGQVVEQLGWYAQEERILQNIQTFGDALRKAQADLESFKEDGERLELHDTTQPAVALYRDIKKIEESIRQQEEQLLSLAKKAEEKQRSIADEESALGRCRELQETAAQELETQRPHINRARSIKGELKAAEAALADKEQAKKKADDDLAKARKAVGDNITAIKKAEKCLLEAQSAYSTLEADIEKEKGNKAKAANEATVAYSAEEEKVKDLDAATLQEADRIVRQQKGDLKEALSICKNVKEVTDSIEKKKEENGRLSDRNKAIDEELANYDTNALKGELDTLQRTYTLMTSENWLQHRSELEEGKPCPLCGATHHPYSSNETFAPVANDMLRLIQEKTQLYEKQTKQEKELSKEKSRNNGSISANDKSVAELQKRLDGLLHSWTVIHDHYPVWPEDDLQLAALQQGIDQEADHAEKALRDYNALTSKVKKLLTKKEQAEKALHEYQEKSAHELKKADDKQIMARTALQTERGKTENLSVQLQEKGEAFVKASEALEVAKANVIAKKQAIKDEIGDNEPESLEKRLNEALAKAAKAVEKQTEAINKLKSELTGINGQTEAAKGAKKKEEDSLSAKKPQLDHWLNDYNGAHADEHTLTIEDIAQISAAVDDWEAIRSRQKELMAAETAARTTLKNEQDGYGHHQEKKPEQDKDMLAARKAVLEQHSNAELVECQSLLSRHEQAKKQMGALFNERQAAEQKRKEWKEIADAIGTDGKTLRQIAQCYTLRFLIVHANAEIRKFNSRYELLQVKNSLGIRVIDHDRADDVRDTTSLSGGETFIVSLGLALGLSSLSSRNISFDNLFIDEGFGTLDPDSLAVVIDSLAMLQSSQGKKVGVISHTDTMSERITTQIRVKKAGSSGSSYIEIYP